MNSKWNNFIDTFQNIFYECSPMKKWIQKRRKPTPSNDEIGKCREHLDILLLMTRKNPIYKELYNKTKKKYDQLIRKYKAQIFEERIRKSDNKSKTMWTICKEIRGQIHTEECEVEGAPQAVSQKLNYYFNNIIPQKLTTRM